MTRDPQEVIQSLAARADRRMLSHAGVRVCWRGFGSGEPLVLVHGGHGSWLHWVRNIEALARKNAVWVPDLPGFGDSDAPSDPASLDMLLDTLLGTAQQIFGDDTPVDLVGFSFGGVVAAEWAARYRGVRRLALLGPTGHKGRRRERAPLVNWRRSTDEGTMLADLRQNLEAMMLFHPSDALALQVHRHSCVMTRFRSKSLSQSKGVLVDALDRFGGPVSMLWGAEDATGVASEVGPLLCEGHPERHWRSLPGVGHWVQYEAPEQTNAFLEEWLQAAGRPSA
jgi:pimeloyl-ACP methyl ester carboxylesterase